MFIRTPLLNIASETPPASAPVVAPPTTPAPAAPAAAPAADAQPGRETFNNMSAEAFKKRMEEAAEARERSLLKTLGFDKQDDIKAALLRLKEADEAKLSAEEKARKQIEELSPKAKQADALSATLQKYLDLELSQIDEAQRGKLPYGDDPVKQLEWIVENKKEGGWLYKAPVAASASASAPAPKNPATTGGAPGPSPSAPTVGKTAFQQWQEQEKADPVLGALFYKANARAIEATKPKQ